MKKDSKTDSTTGRRKTGTTTKVKFTVKRRIIHVLKEEQERN